MDTFIIHCTTLIVKNSKYCILSRLSLYRVPCTCVDWLLVTIVKLPNHHVCLQVNQSDAINNSHISCPWQVSIVTCFARLPTQGCVLYDNDTLYFFVASAKKSNELIRFVLYYNSMWECRLGKQNKKQKSRRLPPTLQVAPMLAIEWPLGKAR